MTTHAGCDNAMTYAGCASIGADGSYPDVAAKAVQQIAAQNPSAFYGYIRSGVHQKIYLFPLLEDATNWFSHHTELEPAHDYAAVFASTNLQAPISGMEHFNTAVSGEHVGNWIVPLLALPLGALAGYYYRRWQDSHPGKYVPFIQGEAVGRWGELVGPQVGGPWHEMVGAADPQATALIKLASQHAQQYAESFAQQFKRQAPNILVWSVEARQAAPIVGGPHEGTIVPASVNAGIEQFDSSAEALERIRYALNPLYFGAPGNIGPSAIAMFDRTSPHWPNPVNWHKTVGPEHDAAIAQYLTQYVTPTVSGPWHEMIGAQPWLNMTPMVGGPWHEMVGGPWHEMVGGPWHEMIGGPWHEMVGGPWHEMVGAQAQDDAARRAEWPQTKALIEAAIAEVTDYASMNPAEAYVWNLDAPTRDPYAGSTPGSTVTLGPTTNIVPFATQAQALAHLREVALSHPVALAMFERSSGHWPNPTAWRKSSDPADAQVIAQHVASRSGTQMSGTYMGADVAASTAIMAVRHRAQQLADRRAGNVVGVIHTPKDGLWHTLAFRNEDDADDWIEIAAQSPDSFTYAAYFNKNAPQWPRAVIEKISGMRSPPGTGLPRRSAPVVGAGFYHTVGDRERALAQLAMGFTMLQNEVMRAAGWRADPYLPAEGPVWEWWKLVGLPTIEAWQKFQASQTSSWTSRFAASWTTYEQWHDRLVFLRETAKAHGLRFESPDPAPLGSTIQERAIERLAPQASATRSGAALDDNRARGKQLASSRRGNAAGAIRASDGLWHVYGFTSLDDAIDWLQSVTREKSRFIYAAAYEKARDGTALIQDEEFGSARARTAVSGWAA
jgi:hypothetical protein